MKRVVEIGPPPGLLAYAGTEAIGWCAVAPRADYPRLASSRALKPVDDLPVWSVSCLFIRKDWRRRGVSQQLLVAAINHVRRQGGRIIEGYPFEPRKERMPDVFAWTGLASAYRAAGFQEVARHAPGRPIMRCMLSPPKSRKKQPRS